MGLSWIHVKGCLFGDWLSTLDNSSYISNRKHGFNNIATPLVLPHTRTILFTTTNASYLVAVFRVEIDKKIATLQISRCLLSFANHTIIFTEASYVFLRYQVLFFNASQA
jgi:hypothetical protein